MRRHEKSRSERACFFHALNRLDLRHCVQPPAARSAHAAVHWLAALRRRGRMQQRCEQEETGSNATRSKRAVRPCFRPTCVTGSRPVSKKLDSKERRHRETLRGSVSTADDQAPAGARIESCLRRQMQRIRTFSLQENSSDALFFSMKRRNDRIISTAQNEKAALCTARRTGLHLVIRMFRTSLFRRRRGSPGGAFLPE